MNSLGELKIPRYGLPPSISALIASILQSPMGSTVCMPLHSLVKLHLSMLNQASSSSTWRRVGITPQGFVITDDKGRYLEGDRKLLQDLERKLEELS